ncbi:MAG: CPBP family intramembrane metalloprotease [Oscillospiraceae bacterium]|nr:CPBP family intramembrane metalloprotease [Oscillospiraceae bacterium]
MTEFNVYASDEGEAAKRKEETAAFVKHLYVLALTVIASVIAVKLMSMSVRHVMSLFPFVLETPFPVPYTLNGFLWLLESGGVIEMSRDFYYFLTWALNDVIIYAAPLLIFGFAFRKRLYFRRRQSYDFKLYWVFPFFAAGYALAFVSNIISGVIAELVKPVFGGNGLRDVFADVMPQNGTQAAVMLFTTVAVAPVCEELIYRHFLLRPLRRFGDAQAVVITSLLFGFFHGNLSQLLYATMGGVMLGIIAVRANSVVPAVMTHMLNNAFDLGRTLLPVSDAAKTAAFFGAVAAGIISLVAMTYLGNLKIGNDNPYISPGERARLVAQNPLILIMAILLAAVTISGS